MAAHNAQPHWFKDFCSRRANDGDCAIAYANCTCIVAGSGERPDNAFLQRGAGV